MKRFCRDWAFFMAVGILLGNRAFLPGDESKVTEKAAPTASDKEMKRLTDQLGSERFQEREQATEKLLKLGKSALPSLQEAVQSRDAEVRHRAQMVIDRISAADTKKELAKLQGTWRVVAIERDGAAATADGVKQMPLLTIKGSDFYWGENEGGGGTIVRMDPTTNPKTIEYKVNYGGPNGGTYLGIYEFDGDTFKDCLTTGSNQRPKEFTTKPGTGHQLMIHKRVK